MVDESWPEQVKTFGRFIRTQRKLAKLSLRELAAVTDVSNAYLSQLERGLHAPSIRVMKSLAGAFNLSTENLLEQAGMLKDEDPGTAPSLDDAIKADAGLTEAQKEALLAVYHSFVQSPERPAPG
jgi:transcriptional regulator with XRE-family HTH domain